MAKIANADDDTQLLEALPPEDAAKVRTIRAGVRDVSRAFRRRHPWLDRFQNEIGLGLMLGSAAIMLASGIAYARGAMPAWLVVFVVAFVGSVAHEVEHDLIHRMYYPRLRSLQHIMFAIGWIMRPSSVNPWVRRHFHIEHHRISGTEGDLEERWITNGEPWNIRRLFMTGDGFLATVLRLPYKRPKRAFKLWLKATLAYGPLPWLYHFALISYIGLNVWAFSVDTQPALLASWLPTVNFVGVVWLLPNILRTFCLHFVSSNVHYYGDVKPGDILHQTQVIDRWYFLPFQLFCFNFGSTHAIHHFWVSEPFYIRQWTAKEAHALLRQHGVRFNDIDTFRRANRYGEAAQVKGWQLEAKRPTRGKPVLSAHA
jgi:fatty acid desaturase